MSKTFQFSKKEKANVLMFVYTMVQINTRNHTVMMTCPVILICEVKYTIKLYHCIVYISNGGRHIIIANYTPPISSYGRKN